MCEDGLGHLRGEVRLLPGQRMGPPDVGFGGRLPAGDPIHSSGVRLLTRWGGSNFIQNIITELPMQVPNNLRREFEAFSNSSIRDKKQVKGLMQDFMP